MPRITRAATTGHQSKITKVPMPLRREIWQAARQFDGHHAEPARMLLDQIDGLTRQITSITSRVTN